MRLDKYTDGHEHVKVPYQNADITSPARTLYDKLVYTYDTRKVLGAFNNATTIALKFEMMALVVQNLESMGKLDDNNNQAFLASASSTYPVLGCVSKFLTLGDKINSQFATRVLTLTERRSIKDSFEESLSEFKEGTAPVSTIGAWSANECTEKFNGFRDVTKDSHFKETSKHLASWCSKIRTKTFTPKELLEQQAGYVASRTWYERNEYAPTSFKSSMLIRPMTFDFEGKKTSNDSPLIFNLDQYNSFKNSGFVDRPGSKHKVGMTAAGLSQVLFDFTHDLDKEISAPGGHRSEDDFRKVLSTTEQYNNFMGTVQRIEKAETRWLSTLTVF